MNNLFKKIGVGAMSLSLVLGVAASNGLVANAASNVKGKSINISDIPASRLQMFLNIRLGSKLNKLGSWGNVALAKKVFNIKVLGAYSLSLNENGKMSESDRIQVDIEELNESNKIKKIENIENDIKGFKDGKQFFEYLFSHGIEKGIHNVRIGDDVLILLFENDVKVGNNKIEDIDKIISEKGDELKNIGIKDIEERDHLDIFV